jgi:hypothetical protein
MEIFMNELLTKEYDQGYEDGYTAGENMNPYDFDSVEFAQYEEGYTDGMDQYIRENDLYDGQPTEQMEWHDFDPDC